MTESGGTPSSRIQLSASSARRTSRPRMHALSSVLKVDASGTTPSLRSWLHLRRRRQPCRQAGWCNDELGQPHVHHLTRCLLPAGELLNLGSSRPT